jgi:hypothetical protein
MSITIQVDLPDTLVAQAQASGLLRPTELGDLLEAELRRRKAAEELESKLREVRSQPGGPMTQDEIVAEVNAVRKERRAREAGR